jgi:hypothetical protein
VDPRTERVGKNEAVFREVNERINDVTRENASEYLCECANATCTETIQMTVSDYENVRSVPTHFAVLPGHELPDLEEVVARNEGSWSSGRKLARRRHLPPSSTRAAEMLNRRLPHHADHQPTI